MDTLYREWEKLEATSPDTNTEDSLRGNLNEGEDSIVDPSFDAHDYRRQSAAEYELFNEWLANNNHMSIYPQFRDHLVLLKEETYYPYYLLQFPDDEKDRASIHH